MPRVPMPKRMPMEKGEKETAAHERGKADPMEDMKEKRKGKGK